MSLPWFSILGLPVEGNASLRDTHEVGDDVVRIRAQIADQVLGLEPSVLVEVLADVLGTVDVDAGGIRCVHEFVGELPDLQADHAALDERTSLSGRALVVMLFLQLISLQLISFGLGVSLPRHLGG